MKTSIHIHFLILLTFISAFSKSANSFFVQKEKPLGSPSKVRTIEPFELINFEAVRTADKVELFWKVNTKSHQDYFTLERSSDGTNFEKIVTVDAGGNTNHLIQYIETDHSPLKGKAYYRLKLTDIKHKSTYSNVIVVNGEKSNFATSKPTKKVDFKKLGDTPVLVVLRDAHGKEHYSKVQVKPEDSAIIGTDRENRLSPGTYLIKGTSYNALYSHKLIVR